MTGRVVLGFGHSAAPMGQQLHERWLLQAIAAARAERLSIRATTIRSWRTAAGSAPGSRARRAPLSLIGRLPPRAQRFCGRCVYGRADLYHRFDLRLPASPGPELVTVHDLPGMHFADEGPVPESLLRAARTARGVICPSLFAAAEVRSLTGATRVWVVPNGVSPCVLDAVPLDEAALGSLGIDRPFVLHAAGSTARKNLTGLAAAWRLLKQDAAIPHLLVQCGPTSAARAQAFAGLADVIYLGHVTPEMVAGLMRSSSAVVVPSLYEGFGLPALEGMASGVPVVAANRGALPEVCRDGALLVEPDGRSLAAGLDAVLSDRHLAGRLRDAGTLRASAFSWQRAAEQHLQIYAEVLDA